MRTYIRDLREAGAIKAKPKVEVETKKASGDTKKVKTDVKSLDKVTGLAKVKVKDEASKPVKEVQGKLKAYAAVTAIATLKVNDQASSRIAAVRSSLASLNGQSATVTTYHRSVYTSSGNKVEAAVEVAAPRGRTLPGLSSPRTLQDARKSGVKVSQAFLRGLDRELGKIEKAVQKAMKKAGKARDQQLKSNLKDVKKLSNAYKKQIGQYNQMAQQLRQLRQQASQYAQQIGRAWSRPATRPETALAPSRRSSPSLTTARDEAVAFAKVMADLKGKLNRETYEMLASAGPENGLAAAEAIRDAGKSGIDEINKLQNQISKAGQKLGLRRQGRQVRRPDQAVGARAQQDGPSGQPPPEAVGEADGPALRRAREVRTEGQQADPQGGQQLRVDNSVAQQRRSHAPRSQSVPRTSTKGEKHVGGTTNVLNYYAASSKQMSSEEELFSASKRGRMVFLSGR